MLQVYAFTAKLNEFGCQRHAAPIGTHYVALHCIDCIALIDSIVSLIVLLFFDSISIALCYSTLATNLLRRAITNPLPIVQYLLLLYTYCSMFMGDGVCGRQCLWETMFMGQCYLEQSLRFY